MNFDINENKDIVVLLGAGCMGLEIIKRISTGKTVLLGDISETNLMKAENELLYGGYDVKTMIVDACSKESIHNFACYANKLGNVKYFIDTAGASPNQATPQHIINLDLIGTSYAIDEFAKVISKGGAGLIVSSQTGYMMNLSPEIEHILATTPTDQLKDLDYLKNDALVNSGAAYIISKRTNQLRVQAAAATTWNEARARINTISPGIIITPLAYDEFKAAGDNYQKMIDSSPARRVGTASEVGEAGAFLLSDRAGFITGTDLLIDGGVIASIKAGKYKLNR